MFELGTKLAKITIIPVNPVGLRRDCHNRRHHNEFLSLYGVFKELFLLADIIFLPLIATNLLLKYYKETVKTFRNDIQSNKQFQQKSYGNSALFLHT